jgi:periplasmic divalent cation tolerance protein
MIFVYITCKNKKEAEKIGLVLIEEKLAACVNYFPIGSIYRWQEKIIKDKEFILIIKTRDENFEAVEKRIGELHSYKIPCIVALPVSKVAKNYFNWLGEQII